MRDYLKNEQQLTESSEAVRHLHRRKGDAPMESVEPHPGEKEERGAPREMVSLGNSYSALAVGRDKKGDLTISGAVKRRHSGASVEQDEKRVRGSRRKRHAVREGEFFTNPANAQRSAFAFRISRHTPDKRILRNLRENARRHDLGRFNEAVPFLNRLEDERALVRMRAEHSGDVPAMERITAEKRIMEVRFLRELRLTKKRMEAEEKQQRTEDVTPAPQKQAKPDSSDENKDEDEGEK